MWQSCMHLTAFYLSLFIYPSLSFLCLLQLFFLIILLAQLAATSSSVVAAFDIFASFGICCNKAVGGAPRAQLAAFCGLRHKLIFYGMCQRYK